MSHNGYRKDVETNREIINKPMLEINEVVGSLGEVGLPVFTKLLKKVFFAATLTSRGSSNRDKVTPLPLCSQKSHQT